MSFDKEWILSHSGMIILVTAVVVEWIALQIFAVHFYFFKQSLKRPTPDGIRFSTIEKVLSFHASQMDRVYGKIGELSKEINSIPEPTRTPERTYASLAPIDSSTISTGEMNLKKRLNELKNLN